MQEDTSPTIFVVHNPIPMSGSNTMDKLLGLTATLYVMLYNGGRAVVRLAAIVGKEAAFKEAVSMVSERPAGEFKITMKEQIVIVYGLVKSKFIWFENDDQMHAVRDSPEFACRESEFVQLEFAGDIRYLPMTPLSPAWERELEHYRADAIHWRANHENMVKRSRILMERPDLPIERVKAFDYIGELENRIKVLETELAATDLRANANKQMFLAVKAELDKQNS